MTNMKTDGLNEYDKNEIWKSIENSYYDDVPNLGSVITLDNKGRLINSQFSKPSSSQTLLKLNSSEEVPDADDLPYSVISYGDTPNTINLPYNDHNYIGTLSNKHFDNYDKKALEYTTKQTIQFSNRSNFPPPTNLRISHFSSFNTNCLSQNDFVNTRTENLFFNDKVIKPNNQFNFNQTVSVSVSALAPLIANKPLNNNHHHQPQQHHQQQQQQQQQQPQNGFLAKKQLLPNTIVINSNAVNKLKSMSVIKLQRSNLEPGSINESRIINVCPKKPNLTSVMSQEPISNDINTMSSDKSDKTINLIPRCICGFIHDDGGMIRCEICQTWQHIICMYPDNKFPILYKCEKCEPREIDYNRAIATQTNNLIKAGHKAADFLVTQEYTDFDNENHVIDNQLSKSSHTPQYVIVQPELKTSYRHIHDSIHNTQNQIFITNSKDAHLVPPGSPRTSKRKQDLISCKYISTSLLDEKTSRAIDRSVKAAVLTKPNNSISISSTSNNNSNNNNNNNPTAAASFTVNNIVIHSGKTNELQKAVVLDSPMNYNYHLIPTSASNQTAPPIDNGNQRESSTSSSSFAPINDMSSKLKSIVANKPQSHTNLSIAQEQYLRQNNFVVNGNTNNNYQVIRINFNQHVMKAVMELHCNEIILEYNGYVSLSEEYNKEYDFRKHYNPFALFYDKFDHLSLCIDAKKVNSDSKYIRRSCTPNAEVKHKLTQSGHFRFYITPINRISKDMEITIGFDFNYMKCRYQVECACNQQSCELIYMCMEEARIKKAANAVAPFNEYDGHMFTSGVKTLSVLTRPHKKRGRAAKILNTSNRQTIEKPINIENTAPAVVRRNKRGRPPLNRPNGIQRSDVCLKASSDSSSNNCLTEFKEASDNESLHCRTNENLHPSLSLHSNFKNFKRISSSHWSLKAHRKLCASKNSKSCKKLIAPKVGRPLKYKKEKLIEPKKDIDFSSDPPSSPERYYGTEKSFDVDAHMSSNEEYERNMFQYHSEMRQEMSREEEGKYWLEEINNKIYKQKLKEAKKVKRKNRIEKKLSRKLENSKCHNNSNNTNNNVHNQPEIKDEQKSDVDLPDSRNDTKEEIMSGEETEVKTQSVSEMATTPMSNKDKKSLHLNLNTIPSKAKRGRKSLKNNKNYIVSYKASNIDDLKNDLMLISASLEEDPEPEQTMHDDNTEKSKDDLIPTETSMNVTIDADESDRQFSDSFETKKSSFEIESDFGSKFIDSSDEKVMNSSFKSKYRKSISNKSKESAKDALKASREERWVNIMWQRILKSENSDSKSKRKRSKSSFAEESNPSEENPTDCNGLSSPKFGDSDFCDDNLSCDNKDGDSFYKLSCAYKNKRKSNKLKSLLFNDSESKVKNEKLPCQNISEFVTEMKTDSSAMTTMSSEENDNKSNGQSNEQCGLIVYKEQQSNPMEKFSRENSAKLFNENYTEAFNVATSSSSYHPPHAKKRWLSQALLEENLNETSTPCKTEVKLNDAFTEKFSAIDTSSKHSFLPPVITSMDNSAFSLTPQKIAMNPKKRLLNQFSMEDNAFRISSADIGEYRSNKWNDHHQSMDQEQSKTKLTLSEYRKRRYSDKPARGGSSSHETSVKQTQNSIDINREWVGLNDKYSSPSAEDKSKEKPDDSTTNTQKLPFSPIYSTISKISSPHVETFSKLRIITDSSFIPKQTDNAVERPAPTVPKSASLSYINTLNNLKMPGNLDPRLAKHSSLLTAKYLHKIHSELEPDSDDNVHESCPRSPSRSPNSDAEWKMLNANDRGPRTPSDMDELSVHPNNANDCLSTYAPSQGSINSFESQPSPTSDSHFDFEKSENPIYKETRKSSTNCDPCIGPPGDWTNHSVTIGRVAGIQNPDLLQEIEEFDDEYVPLPEKLPERSKEEMETLLLTQKRDSQIREWQEVKQLEREKVKLEHQVRSMQRRMQRATNKNCDSRQTAAQMNSNIAGAIHNSANRTSNTGGSEQKFGLSLMSMATAMVTTEDEKTMKTFNVQLSCFNDRLIEQINIVKNNNNTTTSTNKALAKGQPADLPLSYQVVDTKPPLAVSTAVTTTASCGDHPDCNSSAAYSKYRKRGTGVGVGGANIKKEKSNAQKQLHLLPPPAPEVDDEKEEPCAAQLLSHSQQSWPTTISCQKPTDRQKPPELTSNSGGGGGGGGGGSSSSISDHVPHFKPIYPEMTSSFM